uniref:asparagine synthase (glutamine-hydrolyzing) n=1 Tax=Flavobacterium sp. TaxID=239 RepID=UPI0040480B0D
MCGILFAIESKYSFNSEKYENALQHMYSRGPDHSQLRRIENVIFGHTRLAILDLTDAANQPFESIDKKYIIVFNGEIYNYESIRTELQQMGVEFRTKSDTEVLLNGYIKWGRGILNKIRGIFAFVIYDSFEKKYFAARDRYGVKPLFYAKSKEGIFFASDIKVIRSLIGKFEVDHDVAKDYLIYGNYDDSEKTFVKNIYNLRPGHFIDSLGCDISAACNWWDDKYTINFSGSYSEAKIKIRQLFLEGIALNQVSDVDISISLSGGIDSSAIASAVRAMHPHKEINAFSYVASDKKISEYNYISIVAEEKNLNLHKVYIPDDEINIKDLKDLVYCQGEPFVSLSLLAQYYVYKEVHNAGFKVVLDGQGADEIFAGYQGYPGSYLKSLIESSNYLNFARYYNNWMKFGGRNIKYMVSSLLKYYMVFPLTLIYSTMSEIKWKKILKHWSSGDNKPLKDRYSFSEDYKGRRVREKLLRELRGHGLASLLRHGDRSAMRWSVESRVPFLHEDLVDFCLSLPDSYLCSISGETKAIFKEAISDLMPVEILNRRDKIGFIAPQKSLIINNIKLLEYITSINHEKNIFPVNDFDTFIKSNLNNDKIIWRLFNFILWFEMMEDLK